MKGKLRKPIALLMVLIMIFSMSISVLADDEAGNPPTDVDEEIIEVVEGEPEGEDVIDEGQDDVEGEDPGEDPGEGAPEGIEEDEEEEDVDLEEEGFEEEPVEAGVFALFATYTITYIAGTGGEIDGVAVQNVVKGGSTEEVTAVADEGYIFKSWSDGNDNATRNEKNVQKSAKYTAEFIDLNTISNDTIVPAEEPELVEGELEPGTIAASKEAEWKDYSQRLAEITLSVEGMPIISGSDVILVMDVSGSMKEKGNKQGETRIKTAQKASIEFINGLLGNGNKYNNRVAFIPFSGVARNGGIGDIEVANATKGSVNFTYDISELKGHVNATVAEGSTNYSAALQKAINYSDSRLEGEENRPLYVVFMSDGAPGYSGGGTTDENWNGIVQAAALKDEHEATIYTIGIQLGENNIALNNISSIENGSPLYTPVSDMNDLENVLDAIAGGIKFAGTKAVFTDVLSEYFEFVSADPDEKVTYDEETKTITIEVGRITKEPKTYKIIVRLINDENNYWQTEKNYPTNNDVRLDYDDVNGEDGSIEKDDIGDPELPVGVGTIKVNYVLVNKEGKYLGNDGKTIVDYAYRNKINSYDFESDGSKFLEFGQTYEVNAVLPEGYLLLEGETSSVSILINEEKSKHEIEFKVYAKAEAEVQKYTVIFKDYDGTILKTEIVEHGKDATAPANPSRSDYNFNGWDKSYKNVTSDLVVTAQYTKKSTGGGGSSSGGTSKPKDKDPVVVVVPVEEIPADLPQLNKADHIQYIQGYPDGTVKPEGHITRDEVAAVFFRLLEPAYREKIRTENHNFSDVASTRWSNKHIATLAKGGIITGYLDGTFKPGNYITRSELATIASRFDNLSTTADDKFSDIAGHWANKYINSAAEKGWVKGYVDGTFKPDQNITRAEFVTLVNNVLERRVTRSEILPESKKFPDLPEDKWYYEAMMEAVNSHRYERLDNGYEHWTEIYKPIIEM